MAESLAPAARAPMQSRSGQRLLHFLFNSLLPEVTPEQQNQLRAVHANPPEPTEDERGSHGAELKAILSAVRNIVGRELFERKFTEAKQMAIDRTGANRSPAKSARDSVWLTLMLKDLKSDVTAEQHQQLVALLQNPPAAPAEQGRSKVEVMLMSVKNIVGQELFKRALHSAKAEVARCNQQSEHKICDALVSVLEGKQAPDDKHRDQWERIRTDLARWQGLEPRS